MFDRRTDTFRLHAVDICSCYQTRKERVFREAFEALQHNKRETRPYIPDERTRPPNGD